MASPLFIIIILTAENSPVFQSGVMKQKSKPGTLVHVSLVDGLLSQSHRASGITTPSGTVSHHTALLRVPFKHSGSHCRGALVAVTMLSRGTSYRVFIRVEIL